MLIKNMDEMNVNGSMGTVVEFVEPNQYLTNPDDPYGPGSKPPSKSDATKAKSSKQSASMVQKLPVVEFLNPRRRMLVQPETWKVELPNGEVQVSRTQVSQYSRLYELPLELRARSFPSFSLGQCQSISRRVRRSRGSVLTSHVFLRKVRMFVGLCMCASTLR